MKETKVTTDGEIAEKSMYELDQNRIAEESKYDGFYAVITNLEGNVEEILSTIRSMQLTLLSGNSGYVPSYKRTASTLDFAWIEAVLLFIKC